MSCGLFLGLPNQYIGPKIYDMDLRHWGMDHKIYGPLQLAHMGWLLFGKHATFWKPNGMAHSRFTQLNETEKDRICDVSIGQNYECLNGWLDSK